MRYLRMLSNSMAAACLATAYVLALVLHLNPMLPLHPLRLEPFATTVGLFYAVHLTVACYVLLVLRQMFAREVFSPAWISVDVLAWLGSISAAAGAALMWANADAFGRVIDPVTADALRSSVAVLAGASALFVVLAAFRRRRPEARAVWGFLFVVIAGASIAAPLALRGRGVPPLLDARPLDAALDAAPPERSARVTVIALDAGSLDFITGATAEGRLPNFGRMLDAGAARHLATIHPTSPEAVWAAVATGKLPQKNGVRSAGIYQLQGGGGSLQLLPDFCFAHGLVRFGFLIEQPHTSTTFRARTLWSILSTAGIPVGVVGWPLTQPAPPVRGFVVSDMYLRLAATASGIDEPSTIAPPELQADALAALETTAGAVNDAAVVSASLAGDSRYETPGRTDRIYDAIAQAMARARQVQVTLTRYQSLDPIGHYFLRYAMPSEFGDVTDEERRRLGAVLDRHYAIIDEAIGRAMAAVGPDDLLLVVSGYGMEPLGFGKRVIERLIGDPDVSGTHEAAPDGFLMAYGGSVARGRQQARASVVDIVPTILYFLGLPIGRDMDGYARTDLFQRAFIEERPITFIPTYER
ncbi:MAG TPA: alkaline phosphatase family protein [Vicinamibacterales bacterium]|nr:alkaline phosphatase family protein [Vicinamibacterales bacterium]